ncbi:HAMP domain-containing histidine kinase [bacterium]|nr:HAMP domain-containing histidine kinase [bacterium]
MRFNSIKFKISILYTAILGVILIIYSGILFLSLHYTLYHDLDQELRVKAQEIGKMIGSYLDVLGDDPQSFILAVKRVINLEGADDYINFLGPRGEFVINSSNMPPELSHLFSKGIKRRRDGVLFENIRFDRRNLRVITVPFTYRDQTGFIIQVGTSLKPIIHILQSRLLYIAVTIPVILVFAMFLGRLLVTRILQPVVEITKAAQDITYEDLSTRVKAKDVDVEMRCLVDAFNEMISRLEKSFEYIAEFSSQVAHELKTPLAIIRGESEIALRRERDPEEYKEVIRGNLEEVQRMLKTVEDLLLLTRLDYRPENFKFEQFDLLKFFSEIYEQSKILASAKNITANISMPESPIDIKGNRLHLRRALFNLIDNALKFTPQNGKIDMALRCEDGKATISISDTGVGIAEEDLPKIFDRFFHKDRTGEDIEPGNGLGLSIAQSVAQLHRGDIKVKSLLGKGSTFTITLPTAYLL